VQEGQSLRNAVLFSGFLIQDQLPVAVQRDTATRVVLHTDFALLFPDAVCHIVTQHFLCFVINRFAALLRRGVGIAFLQVALDLVTGIAAAQRAHDRSDMVLPNVILFFESFSDRPSVALIAKLLLIAQPGGIPVNKSMLAGIGIGVAAALGVAAVASLDVFSASPKYAQVVSATPIKETVKTPRQECRNVTVTHRRPVQDENRLTGSVLGAVAGGVIGHQFGGGRGKDVAPA